MAIIDYQSIRSFAFARLSLSARVLIPVLATLCDDASGLLSEADSRASALAEYSGLGERSVRSALADLVQAGVIECDRRPGRAPRIVYLPAPAVAAVSGDKAGWGVRGECRSLAPGDLWGGLGGSVDSTLRQILPDTPATVADHPGKFCRGQSDEKMPQTPDFTDEIENGKNVALNNSFKEKTTTTRSHFGTFRKGTAASKVRSGLISRMRKKVGGKLVADILEAMDFLNGEVENPNAFFRYFCEQGVIPDYKAARERRELVEAARKREEQAAEAQRVWKEEAKRIQAEKNDPAVQERVRKVQEDFWQRCSD